MNDSVLVWSSVIFKTRIVKLSSSFRYIYAFQKASDLLSDLKHFLPCTNPQNILVLALNKHLLHSSQLIINFDWHGCRFSCSVLIRSKDKTHPLLMERARVILSVARAYWARTLFMKPSGHIINIPPISLLLWNSHSRGQWPYCSLSIAWIRNQWCMTAPNGSMRAISIFLCLSK